MCAVSATAGPNSGTTPRPSPRTNRTRRVNCVTWDQPDQACVGVVFVVEKEDRSLGAPRASTPETQLAGRQLRDADGAALAKSELASSEEDSNL